MSVTETQAISALLIDDDPFQLRLLSYQLAKLGLSHIQTCESATDALSWLPGDAAEAALIFLDLNLPDVDGVEFVRLLVNGGYKGGLVLVSGENDRIVEAAVKLAKAHRLDVLGALSKPVDPQRLHSIVTSWRGKAQARPGRPSVSYDAGELRRAIEQGELVNFYQPKVLVATGEMVGVECLVRWQHPRDGLVFPDRFIGLAEECGLIDDLTRAVFAMTLDQLMRWREAGLQWTAAVNVSMDSLSQLDFPEYVLGAVTRAGLTPRDVVFEVTESRLMLDPVAALDILTRLRLKRFSLSVDDFGTGHSSLAQLRDIPFDEIKIDRGFVHGAGRSETLRAIFDASHGMARQLGMKTVAEGVEDAPDWAFLRERGCDVAQGYFIAKPMAAIDLPQWWEGWEARRHALV